MAAPGIAVQFLDRFDNAGPDGIEMDIADKRQQIVIFVAKDGFVSILKQVTGAMMAPIEVLCVNHPLNHPLPKFH